MRTRPVFKMVRVNNNIVILYDMLHLTRKFLQAHYSTISPPVLDLWSVLDSLGNLYHRIKAEMIMLLWVSVYGCLQFLTPVLSNKRKCETQLPWRCSWCGASKCNIPNQFHTWWCFFKKSLLYIGSNFYIVVVVQSLIVSNSLWPHGMQHARLPYP